jgi:hypothetical protein
MSALLKSRKVEDGRRERVRTGSLHTKKTGDVKSHSFLSLKNLCSRKSNARTVPKLSRARDRNTLEGTQRGRDQWETWEEELTTLSSSGAFQKDDLATRSALD